MTAASARSAFEGPRRARWAQYVDGAIATPYSDSTAHIDSTPHLTPSAPTRVCWWALMNSTTNLRGPVEFGGEENRRRLQGRVGSLELGVLAAQLTQNRWFALFANQRRSRPGGLICAPFQQCRRPADQRPGPSLPTPRPSRCADRPPSAPHGPSAPLDTASMTSIPRVHPSQRKNSPDTPGRIRPWPSGRRRRRRDPQQLRAPEPGSRTPATTWNVGWRGSQQLSSPLRCLPE